MKTFAAHPVMLEDADLDYVTGGISGVSNSNLQGVADSSAVTGSISNSGNFTQTSGNNNNNSNNNHGN